MDNLRNKWESLSYKDKLSYSLAIAAFTIGWIITIIGFFVSPVGEIHSTVLWVLGQSLLFTGSIIGIAQYYHAQLNDFKSNIIKNIKRTKDEEVLE